MYDSILVNVKNRYINGLFDYIHESAAPNELYGKVEETLSGCFQICLI